MSDKYSSLLSSCSEIDFGDVPISEAEDQFCQELNNEIILFCKSLPQSTQADALLFLMRYFRIPFGKELAFFKNYYTPAWSVIYWLMNLDPAGERLRPKDRQNAKAAHAMALLLHPFDDHLNDSQLPASHLTVLLRSQAWMLMLAALNGLVGGIETDEAIVQDYLDVYYDSVTRPQNESSLDEYCEFFRKQMATWLIVPMLMSNKLAAGEDFSEAVQAAYGSFGIAWRLLDDINDLEIDLVRGNHSAVYSCLPDHLKTVWDEKNSDTTKTILDAVLNNFIIDKIKDKINQELQSAVALIDRCHLPGLANELRHLAGPLQKMPCLYEQKC